MKTPLFRCALLIFFGFFGLTCYAFAQGRSGGGRPSTGSPGLNGSSPTLPTNGINVPPSAPTAIFVSGKVVLDDGTELTEPAIIQTICRGQKHNEAYSDTHGGFSFQFGDSRPSSVAAVSDASSSNEGNRLSGQSSSDLGQCQLQAELAGFSSQPVELGGRAGLMNNIEVGRVPMHRLAHVDGSSISVTSALAPAPAKKAFEKGLEQARKGKLDEAQKSFEKAVQIYPRYATAWYQLGRVQLLNKTNRDPQLAKHSFEQSVAADAKYVNPYDGLAQLAMMAGDWRGVIDITGKLLSLNPVNFPDAYYDCAVANYRLKNFEDAEKSALQGIRVDEAHQIPKLQYVLAVILLQKQNYQAASEHMQLYLHLAKDPDEIELAKKGLAQIESSSARAQPPVIDLDK
jgi:tetratricopeptide (TPR) repeat protein